MSSCCCDCCCECPPKAITCPPNTAPQPPYNVAYTGAQADLSANWFISQSTPSAPFSTNPNWPLNTGANHSQVQTNQQAKTIFTNINARKENGTLFPSIGPTFKSNHERILYLQAQYAQAVYLPKKGINTLYT